MKGTIDIQIKRKDGSIENRHEHNVVFDLPAEIMKKITRVPILGLRYWNYLQLGTDNITNILPSFSLCEDTADLTRPKYLPCSLTTTRSSSSVWYTPALTVTTNDKNITAQASWTLGEAMTIKSIRIMGNYNPDYSRPNRRCQVIDDHSMLHVISEGDQRGKRLSVADFKFTNTTAILRLVPSSELDSNQAYVTLYKKYYSYPLANDERFAFFNDNGGENPLSINGYVSLSGTHLTTGKIRIFNASTDEMVREFPFSQFSGLTTYSNVTYYLWVVNTGTKNILIRARSNSTTDDPHIKCWQIPDSTTQDPIPTVNITFPDNFPSYPQAVLDNCILYGSTGSASVIKLNDDLSVTMYKGRLNGHVTWDTDSYRYPYGYLPTGVTFTTNDSTVYYPNLTAANFSTPIELAEGDVLTVSYKIEVS